MSSATDWAETPDAALAYYLSLTFEQQTALAFVIDWHRTAVQKQAKEMIAKLQGEYAKAKA